MVMMATQWFLTVVIFHHVNWPAVKAFFATIEKKNDACN